VRYLQLEEGSALMNPWTIPLRDWQMQSKARWQAKRTANWLVAATPGAGKTMHGGNIAYDFLTEHANGLIVVVTPTAHLKRQWRDDCTNYRVGLDFVTEWDGTRVRGGTTNGVCVTYQALSMGAAQNMRALVSRQPTLVILDEIHHCGVERSWGDAVGYAFEPAIKRLLLSGTPFRTTGEPIPFVNYEHTPDERGFYAAIPDFFYRYGDALIARPQICRPIFFPKYDGDMEWVSNVGEMVTARFEDVLPDEGLVSQRLNTALDIRGQWLPEVIREMHKKLMDLRRIDPDAGGLIIAKETEHADGIADLVRRLTGVDPVVAHNEKPDASEAIKAFKEGSDPWLIAVKMVSEGVDIPRLRVGIYATNVVAPLFFIQAVGRFVRAEKNHEGEQSAFLAVPSDERLTSLVKRIMGEVDAYKRDLEQRESLEASDREVQGTMWFPISSTADKDGTLDFDGNEYSDSMLSVVEPTAKMMNVTPETALRLIIELEHAGTIKIVMETSKRPPAPMLSMEEQCKTLQTECHRLINRLARREVDRQTDQGDYASVARRLNHNANVLVGTLSVKHMSLQQLEAKRELLIKWWAHGVNNNEHST
jgi:superfamily II DNA or RNA helicase